MPLGNALFLTPRASIFSPSVIQNDRFLTVFSVGVVRASCAILTSHSSQHLYHDIVEPRHLRLRRRGRHLRRPSRPRPLSPPPPTPRHRPLAVSHSASTSAPTIRHRHPVTRTHSCPSHGNRHAFVHPLRQLQRPPPPPPLRPSGRTTASPGLCRR